MTEKEEIASTEFPEGGDTIYTKGPPASPRGEYRHIKHPNPCKQTLKKIEKNLFSRVFPAFFFLIPDPPMVQTKLINCANPPDTHDITTGVNSEKTGH